MIAKPLKKVILTAKITQTRAWYIVVGVSYYDIISIKMMGKMGIIET